MPHTTHKEDKDETENVPSAVVRWWRKFHFSGRVIMCSVLFGLGLILIGGLLFAISTDDEDKPQPEDVPQEVPTKAPSSYVGPAVMGVGGFVVIVGVIMCLFETQVCRKRTGDSSPLIPERPDPERKDSEPTTVPSTAHYHKNHRHEKRKVSSSPKRSKCRSHKSHSKERNQQKGHSPKTPPISIGTPKSFLTSSEDKFLTPPNTLETRTAMMHNSRDAENQTSSSLMKSFTSSGPSWTQSTEFQTPSTSFGDQSMSLENSVEVGEKQVPQNLTTTEFTQKSSINVEYFTPIPQEDEKVKEMSSKIQIHKNELSDPLTLNVDDGLTSNQVSDAAGISETSNSKDNKSTISQVEMKSCIKNSQIIENNQMSLQNDNSSEKDANQILDTKCFNTDNLMEKENIDNASAAKDDTSSGTTENVHQNIDGILDTEKETPKDASEKNCAQDDLSSSASSNETVVSENTSPIKQLNEEIPETKPSELTSQDTLNDKQTALEKDESSADDGTTNINVVEKEEAESSSLIENETRIQNELNLGQTIDIKTEKNEEESPKQNYS